MKSAYDDIVKIKKQKLSEAQMSFIKARQEQSQVQNQILALCDEISSINTPKAGNISLFLQTKEVLGMQRRRKEELNKELQALKEQTQNYQKLYEIANLEYEKMLYLKEEEIKKHLKKLKQKEQLELDEIALQLFTRTS